MSVYSSPGLGRWDDLKTLGFAAIGAAYTQVGSALTNAGEIVCFINDTDAVLIVSIDATRADGQWYCPPKSSKVYDLYTNNKTTHTLEKFFVKHNGVAPTLGNFVIEVCV